jgi:hypothetical protein
MFMPWDDLCDDILIPNVPVAVDYTTEQNGTKMTSTLLQADSIAASDPAQAEQLYKQVLSEKTSKQCYRSKRGLLQV